MRQPKKPPDTDQESDDQPKLVTPLKASLSVPGSQQIPKEKETQDQTIEPSPFLCMLIPVVICMPVHWSYFVPK